MSLNTDAINCDGISVVGAGPVRAAVAAAFITSDGHNNSAAVNNHQNSHHNPDNSNEDIGVHHCESQLFIPPSLRRRLFPATNFAAMISNPLDDTYIR
jgi:pyruvate kinase